MFGSKVFLTYKRKRQSLSSSFDHGNWCHNSFCEDAHNCSLSTQDKHDKLTVEETSEKHEGKPMDTSDGRKLCFGCVKQPDCSSSLPVQKPYGLKAGEHGNYDATEMIVTTQKSFSTRRPCEDTFERDVGELRPVEKASQNGRDTHKNSCASESSGNECDNCSNKNFISPSVELDAGNGFSLVSSETSITREFSSARVDESPVLNKSMEEFTDSPSKDNFGNPSALMVMQTNLTSPFITLNRCYKRKKSLYGTDRQSELLHKKENISVLTKWSMLANGNAYSSDESSCEECPVESVPDLNQSVELSEKWKPLNQTQDETCCRSCPVVFLTDLNQSAELSERGELYQTREKVKNADSPCTCGVVSETCLTHMREQLHDGEDIVKTVCHTAGTEPNQSCLIYMEAQHLHRDCQGVSINVDFRDPCPAATTADQELEKSRPSVREAIQNVLCNGVKKIGGHQPQFDLPVNLSEQHIVDLNFGADKHPLHLRMRTLGDKLDSTSSSSAIAKDQVSEVELLNSKNTLVIQDISFIDDSKWIIISSSRGTSHLFAINPQGGYVNIQSYDDSFTAKNTGLGVTSNQAVGWCCTSALQMPQQQTLFAGGPPITLSVVSRIRGGGNCWRGTVSGAAALQSQRCLVCLRELFQGKVSPIGLFIHWVHDTIWAAGIEWLRFNCCLWIRPCL